MDKRTFIKAITATTAMTCFPQFFYGFPKTAKPKKVLILGGRNFVGPSIVNVFKQAGWEVTLLNRGITNPHLFKELPIIICNREKENKEGIKEVDAKIRAHYWDAVVDTWQKSPKAVSDFISEYKDQFAHYHYISSIAVYANWSQKFIDETSPLKSIPAFPKSISEEYGYSIRKTLAESAITEQLSKYTIYRSHGMRDFRTPDHENPNEEPYWPIRFARGGEIMVPEVKDHHYQMTDVQSLCRFIVRCTKNSLYGAFNVAYDPIKFKDYVHSLIQVTGEPKKLHWISGSFLKAQGIRPYRDLPAWRDRPAGAYYFNISKANKAGLINRSLEEVAQDQLNGYRSRYPLDDLKFGGVYKGHKAGNISMETEKKLIKKWLLSTN
jgi:nucleoside-diphosphate-sugar epimerase